LMENLPQYDFVYYGDTANLPYGDKTGSQICNLTVAAMKFLIQKDCGLIIIACNTACSASLRYIQQVFIPEYSPSTKVLGVVIPTVEEAVAAKALNVGVIATEATVRSGIYATEINKIDPHVRVIENAAPKLVPLIEANRLDQAAKAAEGYLRDLQGIDTLILGCTHYPIIKSAIREIVGKSVRVISQDEIIAEKTRDYLRRHHEIEARLGKSGLREFYVSRMNKGFAAVAKLFAKDTVFTKV